MITLPEKLSNFMKGQKLDGLKPFAILYRNKWVLDDESESESSAGNTGHFELDTANPIDISEMIVKPNTLSTTLDVNEIAQYNANNVTLTLADPHNRFIEGVPDSFFPEGYQLYGSKVVLYYGIDNPINPNKSQSDYTVVGSPTITDEGVASGFTANNHIKTSLTSTSNISSLEMNVKFTMPSTYSAGQSLLGYSAWFSGGSALNAYMLLTSNNTIGTYLLKKSNNTQTRYEVDYNISQHLGETFTFNISTNLSTVDVKLYSSNGTLLASKSYLNQNLEGYIRTAVYFGCRSTTSNPFQGKIDIKSTYIKVNGQMWFNGAAFFYNPSVTSVFIGSIKELPTHKPEKYQVDLKLVSPLELLKDIEAKDFSDKVEGEVLTLDHIGDNNEEYYVTANNGVGGITALYANGIKLYEGVDYNVEDLNDLAIPAMVEIINSSLFGQTFTADYYYWKRSLSIEQIVDGLVSLGGYDSTKTDIQPVIWQDEVRNPPTISPVFAALGYYEDSANEYKFSWSGLSGNWQTNKNNGSRRNILPDNFDYSFYFHLKTQTTDYGNAAVSLGDEYNSNTITVQLERDGYTYNINLGECGVNNGISVRFAKFREGGLITPQISMRMLYVLQIINGSPTVLFSTTSGIGSGSQPGADIKITRRNGNEIKVYQNGTEVVSITDNTNLTFQRYFHNGNGYGEAVNQLWNIYDDNAQLLQENLTNPCIITQTLDKTVAGITWGAIQADLGELDGQTYFLRAYFSNDGLTWDNGTSYNLDTDTAHSERYMYYILGISNEPGMSFDIIDPRTYFYATNLVLNMVNLGSRTVLEALQDLSLISGYEFGVDRNGIFFFRPRVASTTPTYELDHNEITKVDTVKKNLNDFFTKLTLSFAQVPLEFYADTGAHPTLIDRYGVINKDIDKPDIVNYDNPELAQAIGPQLLEIYSALPVTIQVVGKLNLALELGDIVNLKRNYPLTADPAGSDFEKYERQDTYYRACKITGMNYNFDKKQITYTLRDVSNKNNIPAGGDENYKFVYDFPIQLGAK